MATKFSKGDKVVVTAKNSVHAGVQGTVQHGYDHDNTYFVELETGRSTGFFERELEFVDPEKEALIRLAETLDSARQQANAIKATEGDTYRKIADSQSSALEAYFGHNGDGIDAYNEIIRSGFSVREAIKYIEGNK